MGKRTFDVICLDTGRGVVVVGFMGSIGYWLAGDRDFLVVGVMLGHAVGGCVGLVRAILS